MTLRNTVPVQPPAFPLAQRADHLVGSVIDSSTSLLASQTHDIVRFAMGDPAAEAVPVELFNNVPAAVYDASSYTYGATEGEPHLIDALAGYLATTTDPTPRERITITSGGMQGLDLACKIFVDPGDLVVVESPTYTNGSATAYSYGADLLEVPVDDDGLVVDELEALVAAAGRAPKAIYTIPNFQNPSGTTLSLARRGRLLELAHQWNSLIIDDDPYGLLRFDGQPMLPLRAGNPDDVIYLGSFSKILAPGLRIGWALLPAHLQRRFYLASESVTLCPPTLNQMLVSGYLEGHDWRGQIATYRRLYAERCAAMLAALEEFMPAGTSWTRPEGGFFVWVTLPRQVDTYPLLHQAIEAGVVFIPGAAFSPSGQPSNHLRLAFSAVSAEQIREGVRRLAPVLQAAI